MKKSVLLPVITIAVFALILFTAALGLKGVAEKNAQAQHLEMMQLLLPDSTAFTIEPYSGEDANIRSVHKAENGYVIETATYSYAGEITLLIGVSNDGRVTGLVVKDTEDTLGLGANALRDHEFLAQFLNTEGNVTVDTGAADAFSGATGSADSAADGVTVDAITGATVTSKAIARCVNSAVAYVTGADAQSAATSWGG